MKNNGLYKRFIFVPVTCLTMLVLVAGYVFLEGTGFLQRPGSVQLKIDTDDIADVKAEVSDGSKVPEKIKTGEELIDINTATAQELMKLPGIGLARAQAIVTQRVKMKGFYSVDDLACTEGIGTKTLENLREFITVSEYKGER